MNIKETEQEIISEFALFDSWDDKYEYIIDLGKKLPALDLKYKINDNRVRGCQSSVWLVADSKNGKLYFQADSDAVIVKGLISMLIRVLNGRTPDEILEAKMDFIREI
ncbi:MAG TPA: SufE family protein, partial [Mucilaginibacter sp.]